MFSCENEGEIFDVENIQKIDDSTTTCSAGGNWNNYNSFLQCWYGKYH